MSMTKPTETIPNINIQLIIVSFVMLFAEIALIRWISTEARIFSYVNNLVLLSCFLGIGLGAFYSRRKIYLSILGFGISLQLFLIWLPVEITIQGQAYHPFKDIPLLLSAFTDSVIWYESDINLTILLTVLGLFTTIFLFTIILITFIPLGQLLGQLLDSHNDTIKAYSLNVAASIAGVWAFSLCSFLYAPAWIWFTIVLLTLSTLLYFPKYHSKKMYLSIGLLAFTILLILFVPNNKPDLISKVWSPYQKLEMYPQFLPNTEIQRGFLLNVNNVGYMSMLDLSDSMINKHSSIFDIEQRKYSQYDIPYLLKKNPDDVLILGAGSGNDASGALRNNAKHVDAVEIDPGIYKLGKQYHPERPYNDSRVTVHIDDARSFLKRTDKLYDIVSFGLLDAHTTSSSFNNIRIDHYVYTLESFLEARSHLKEDGILTLAFEARRPWIRHRLFNLLEEAFGYPPEIFTYPHNIFGWGGSMFIIALDSTTLSNTINADPEVNRFISMYRKNYANAPPEVQAIKSTVDDWPYLYLEKPQIPKLHLSIMAILVLLIFVGKSVVLKRGMLINYHFFFLGAAFLLLEFQNISKATLLFGSTWLVNSFVITGILLLILLANFVVAKWKNIEIRLIYSLLMVSSLIIYFMPLDIFSGLGYWQRAIVVSIILNIPIFFAGMIFIISFKNTSSKDIAFGSNLLGAVVGGILESLSFIVGINALLLIVVLCYILSFVFIKKSISNS